MTPDDDTYTPAKTPLRELDLAQVNAVPHTLLEPEWLVTNGIGGYASGTVANVPTRRYHGLLIAALPVHGRTVMVSHLIEEVSLPGGRSARIGGEERPDMLDLSSAQLVAFRLEWGLPVWHYRFDDALIEKRIWMPRGQNTALVTYTLLAGNEPVNLRIVPSVAFRPHDEPFERHQDRRYVLRQPAAERVELESEGYPPLHIALVGAGGFELEWNSGFRLHHRVEAHRGYGAVSEVLKPGGFRAQLTPAEPQVALIASSETWDDAPGAPTQLLQAEIQRRQQLLNQAAAAHHDAIATELTLAADAFLVTPRWRHVGAPMSEYRSVIAGYHWFTDWGRDTMIALEGLTLATGREREAAAILRTFAGAIRDGLIPNLFPEGQQDGLYHTADATLWFFHAVHRYVTLTGDRQLLQDLLPQLRNIVDMHLRGTRFGIGIDPADGLLRQGAEGYQLTWMDAKVGDWVVTPRRGKPVEINALWYNALRLLQGWLQEAGDSAAAATMAQQADLAQASFNHRFWCPTLGHLYDVVDGPDGDDAACRPNQIFAIALQHPVLAPECWAPVFETVRGRLLTPVGLRSLAPGHPDYKPKYFGNLQARDAAYHQGTVWAWLIGPYIDAWLKLHPDDRAGARSQLSGLVEHLGAAGIGSVSEIFDADPPFTARGCIAQAWSVAELLRCWLKTRS